MGDLARTARCGTASVTASPHLLLEKISKQFGDIEVIPPLDLAVHEGEMVALLGPSGCGKTTMLRMIAGLVEPSGGRIRVDGRDITMLPSHARDMGLVFQSYALFPHMSVAGNVAFGLEMRRMAKSERRRQVEAALARVQLDHLADRRPKELSGGQQQRVALARALVIEPSILLLDEPLSNLDAKLRDEMRTEIREMQQASGITTVFVTHDQVEALSMCDRIVVMRAGRIEQLGTPREIYERPANPFVAGFVGRTNRLRGQADGSGVLFIGDTPIHAPDIAALRGPVDILVRPHRLRLEPGSGGAVGGRNVLRGTLRRYTFVGDLLQSHVAVGDAEILVEEGTRRDLPLLEAGAPVAVAWDAEDTLVFGAEVDTASTDENLGPS